jgi:hypothetical protein
MAPKAGQKQPARRRGLMAGAYILFLATLSLIASAKELSTSEIYRSAKAAVVKLTVLGQHNEILKIGTGFLSRQMACS